MTSPNIEQIRRQAIEQRIHKDSYRTIGQHLDNTEISLEERQNIITEIKDLENSKMLKKQLPKGNMYLKFQSGFFGALVISLGLFMTYFLWGRGWISTAPFLLIIYGLFNITRNSKR